MLVIGLLPILFLLWVDIAEARKTRRLDGDDLVKTWIGISSNGLYLLRLRLEKNGSGLAGFSYLDEEPCIMSVEKWRYQRGRVTIELRNLSPERPACDVGPLEGTLDGSQLKLRRTRRDWSASFLLIEEAPYETRWSRLQAKMGMLASQREN